MEERRFGSITHSKKAQFKFHFSTSGLKRKTRNRIAAMGNTIHYFQFPLLSLESSNVRQKTEYCLGQRIMYTLKNCYGRRLVTIYDALNKTMHFVNAV